VKCILSINIKLQLLDILQAGFTLHSADIAGNVRIWDTTQVEHVLKIELKMLSGPILDLQWSDDSKRIVCVGEGKDRFGAVFLFDSGSSVGEIANHSKPVFSCDFKQTRPYRIATCGEDMLINFFEGPPFKFKKSMKDHTRFVNCIRFSPDGNKFITVGMDKQGFLFDGKTGDLSGKLSESGAHTGGIYSCSWSPDNKRIITASGDKTCKLWNGESGECMQTFQFGNNLEDQQLGSLWQGEEVLSIALSGDITYLDINNPNQPKRVIKGHNKFVTAIAADPNGNTAYTASYDALVIKWDIPTGNTFSINGKGHTNQVVRMLKQGDNLVSIAMDDSLRITPLSSLQYGEAIKLDSSPSDIAVGLKDQSLIITVIVDSIVVIRKGQIVNKQQVKYQPSTVAISVDETQVAVGGKNNHIYLYKLNGNNLTETNDLTGHRGALSSVSYSPDGKFLASADWNRDIFVWDLGSNQIAIQGWQFHTARVNRINWSSDSAHIVSGALDGAIYVWNVQQTGKRVNVKDAHRGGVNDVVFLDNNTVGSVGQDCTFKTWKITY